MNLVEISDRQILPRTKHIKPFLLPIFPFKINLELGRPDAIIIKGNFALLGAALSRKAMCFPKIFVWEGGTPIELLRRVDAIAVLNYEDVDNFKEKYGDFENLWGRKLEPKVLSIKFISNVVKSFTPKIVRVITRLERGGSADRAMLLCHGNFEFKVIAGKSDAPETHLARSSVIRIKEMRRNIHPLWDFLAFIKLLRILGKEKPHIVHTHTSKAGFLGRWAAFFANVPKILYSPHGHIFYGYFDPVRTFIFTIAEVITSFITDFLVVYTEDEKREFERRGCRTRFRYIPMVLKEVPKNVKKAEVKGSPVIGTCGRFEPVKGMEYLIEAFPFLLEEFPKATLVMVGDGSERGKLERLAEELGIKQKTIFTGWLENPFPYLKSFDIFVAPSLNEAWGAAIFEAALMGKPIVATRVGGIPHVAGKFAYLVESSNPQAIADGIKKVLKNKKIKDSLVKISKEEAKKFVLNNALVKIESLYEEILKW